MTDRWFSDEELEQLSRPTMDRAIEAIDAGDLDAASRLCAEMKHEWQMLHDLMAAGVLDLVSFIQQRLGEEGVAEAWTETMNRGWRRHHDAIVSLERRELVELLAATWRAHSCSGVGPNPGSFTITEDEEKVTFSMNPCGSGQRLVRNGAYEGLPDGGVTRRPTTGPSGARACPLYCTHCCFMNESLPIQWSGYPLYPSEPPEDYAKDPCTWHWYKDPDDIPEQPLAPLRRGQARAGRRPRSPQSSCVLAQRTHSPSEPPRPPGSRPRLRPITLPGSAARRRAPGCSRRTARRGGRPRRRRPPARRAR